MINLMAWRKSHSRKAAIYWSVNKAFLIAAVWFRLIPWWAIAILVTLDCMTHAMNQWEKWLASENERLRAKRVPVSGTITVTSPRDQA